MSNNVLEIFNPATEKLIKTLPADTPATIAGRYQRAKTAQTAWAARTLTERVEILRRFNTLLAKNNENLAATLTAEMGKPLSQAQGEVRGTLERILFFLDNVETSIDGEIVAEEPGMTERITREPLGVIGNISAWNYPYFVGTNVIVPGLLAGNAVLYKPSEHATMTGIRLTELLHEAGVPTDVMQVIIGSGTCGAALLEQPLDAIFFTGSYNTGLKIAAAAATQLMKVQLELGGKDPVYIREDVADIAAVAASIADGTFYNTGQSCCSVERIYVHESILAPFIEAFVATVKNFTIGNPTAPNAYIGPLTRAPQLKVIQAQVDDALAKGAKLECGGATIQGVGHYFQPTVLSNVNHNMDVMREESFGPIIGIQSVRDDAEAAKLMADTAYGLTAAVFSPNQSASEAILSTLRVGSAYWNCCDRVSPRLPWSGCGHSGIGLTLSNDGIRTFTRPKGWHLRS